MAQQKGWTETILGRKRNLKEFFVESGNIMKLGMGNRRAINTPIQGSAADIVNSAMVKIARNQKLK
jgi:DNA polymerase I